MINVSLISRMDLERLFSRPSRFSKIPEKFEELGICPIVELLDLCEAVRKGRRKLELNQFRAGLRALQDGPVSRGEIVILSLTQECLIDSLFEREEENVIDLWQPAADRNQCPSPVHTIRRLLLRPSDQTWWDGEVYAEADVIHRTGETATND